MTIPELPYNGTSGWSGSEASRQRATQADSGGLTARRQSDTLNLIERAEAAGITWQELAFHYGWHHGQASGALSNLHKGGHIERLEEMRNKCHVYVLPEWVMFRPTQSFGRKHPHEVIKIDHTTMGNQYVYETPDGGQILVTVFLSGMVRVATRTDSLASWEPPLECIKTEILL
jgi:hypothetical protein